jgi:acyl carrier protein
MVRRQTEEHVMQYSPGNAVFEKVVLAVEQTVYTTGTSLSPASRLADDLRLGRFGRIRLALYLEETFDFEIPDEAVDRFDTVGDIVRYVSRWCLDDTDLPAQYIPVRAN